MAIETIEMDLEFMEVIPGPPRQNEELYQAACSNDGITVNTWKDKWINQTKANHAKYGPFANRHIGKLFGKYARQPVIVAGSGPSLKRNIADLKDTKGIPVVSCLHNFHYFVDNQIPCEYFVTLDAGEVTVEEVSEGGSKTPEEYWEATKNYTLLCYVGTHPKLLEKWQGEILFFNTPIPHAEIMDAILAVEDFNAWISTGGNVLGACVYIARMMGANPVVFVGADFSFSYTKRFHSWNSKYDATLGQCVRAIDVYGNRVLTWQSYYNFKCFFDWVACKFPGLYINCTEGGLLGAYAEGNIAQIKQMKLKDLVRMYTMHEDLRKQYENPSVRSLGIYY